MADSVLTTLGAGSGIDTRKLVADLTAATRQPRERVIVARETANTARLGALAQLSSGVTTIADSARTRLRTLADADVPTFVEDLVGALNELRDQLNTATQANAGSTAPLGADNGARALARALGGFVGAAVAGSSLRLTDLGVATARDGTLTLDSARLAASIATDPAAVKALLGVGSAAPTGLGSALQTLKTTMTGSRGVLGQSKSVYARATAAITRDRARLDTDMATMTDRLTTSFSAMDRQVAAIKASQAYLTQQVAMWTAQR